MQKAAAEGAALDVGESTRRVSSLAASMLLTRRKTAAPRSHWRPQVLGMFFVGPRRAIQENFVRSPLGRCDLDTPLAFTHSDKSSIRTASSEPHQTFYAAMGVVCFRFLRRANQPSRPTPVAKRGRAAGIGVVVATRLANSKAGIVSVPKVTDRNVSLVRI
jgi:hypothetical protein